MEDLRSSYVHKCYLHNLFVSLQILLYYSFPIYFPHWQMEEGFAEPMLSRAVNILSFVVREIDHVQVCFNLATGVISQIFRAN